MVEETRIKLLTEFLTKIKLWFCTGNCIKMFIEGFACHLGTAASSNLHAGLWEAPPSRSFNVITKCKMRLQT